MRPDPYKTGAKCIVNSRDGLDQELPAKPFIGQPCKVVKRTMEGMIMVYLVADSRQVAAFKPSNVDVITK